MNQRGFSLAELLLTIAILAIAMLAVVPMIRKRPAEEQFVQQLNILMQRARHNAVVTGKLHRVMFDTKKGIYTEMVSERKNRQGELQFEPLKKQFVRSSMPWPNDFEIKNFVIDGTDERAKYRGELEKFEVWIFITPSGIAQSVIINIENRQDIKLTKTPRLLSLVLNPFSAQFKQYDTFQK